MNHSDEQLYELAAKELADLPRQGLLIKCMAKTEGDENKAKALYIETRVEEMKDEIRRRMYAEAQVQKEKKHIPAQKQINSINDENKSENAKGANLLDKIVDEFKTEGWLIWLIIILMIIVNYFRDWF